MKPVLVCQVCDGALVPVSLNADGQTLACPCGRTTTTTLSKGKLDLAPTHAPDEPSDGRDLRGGLLP